MTARAFGRRFLDLPPSVRGKIYAYLLLPRQKDIVTTINYSLSWPHLHNPSNTTWAGPTQIDFCTCQGANVDRIERDQHIYTRYKCLGPDVHFTPPREGLWVLEAAHGQINILRPASDQERQDRPSIAILQSSKQVYDEALPFLYRERDFFFVTGPCPRGRYQTYATLHWLKQLSAPARANVEVLSLLIQPYEEDCNIADVRKSYKELAKYIRDYLPRFSWLCLDVWDQSVYQAASVFARLFHRKGVGVVVRRPLQDGEDEVQVFVSEQGFRGSFRGAEV